MPTMRPYSSTSTAGLVCSFFVTSDELTSTSTVGKLRFHHFTHWRIQQFPVAHDFREHAIFAQRTNGATFIQARESASDRVRPSFRAHPRPCHSDVTETNDFGACGFFVPADQARSDSLRFQQALLFQPFIGMMLGQIMLARIANNENDDCIFVETCSRRAMPLRDLFPSNHRRRFLPFGPTCATSQTSRGR